MKRTIVSGVLSAMLLLSVVPVTAFAQTGSVDIQAQLNAIIALQAQLKALQEQTKTVQTQQTTAVAQLTSQLSQGSTGDQVKVLQALLASDSSIYPEGLITGTYGPATTRAIKRLQKEHGLSQVGRVGPGTLALLQSFLSKTKLELNNSTSTSNGNEDNQDKDHGDNGKKACLGMPPGHLIAPGWLKKNGGSVTVTAAMQVCLPKGILDILKDGRGDDHDRDHGTTTSHGDTTAPIITAITSSPSVTAATITWTTNESSNSKVSFGTTTAYGSITMNATGVVAHSVMLTGLTASTLYHFQVSSTDGSGNTATSGDMTFTTGVVADVTAPVLSALSVGSIASTSAAVSWTTNENATGKIYFGSASPFVLGTASTMNSSSLTTTHLFTTSGLTASTTYTYLVVSSDSSGNTATSSPATFNTTN